MAAASNFACGRPAELPEAHGASKFAPPPPRCPFCDSRDAEVLSLFGTQVMTMQVRCRGCGTIYEATKY